MPKKSKRLKRVEEALDNGTPIPLNDLHLVDGKKYFTYDEIEKREKRRKKKDVQEND